MCVHLGLQLTMLLIIDSAIDYFSNKSIRWINTKVFNLHLFFFFSSSSSSVGGVGVTDHVVRPPPVLVSKRVLDALVH